MSSMTKAKSEVREILDLIQRQQPGYSLEQPFYVSPTIFERDMEKVIERQWLFIDHISRIPNEGDYFLFAVGRESIIVVRSGQDTVRAFFNVCRHRGSRVCLEEEGHTRLFTCPYHAWTYRLDGSLVGRRLMGANFDPSHFGLHPCQVRVLAGLIFVCLAKSSAPDFDLLCREAIPFIEPHDLAHSKIAAKRQYPTHCNWKLVVENFYECYHCAPAHREYCLVHSPEQIEAFGAGPGSGNEDAVRRFKPLVEQWEKRAQSLGYPTYGMADPADSINQRTFSRYPLGAEGMVSDARGGKPASRLAMGSFRKNPDGGNTALAFNPLSSMSASNDYAVMFRFTPRSVFHTDVELTWLVAADAQEGRDYNVDNLVWLWDVTTRQDKKIAEDNQAGILSSRYVPGPYSSIEGATDRVVRWYLRQITQEDG